jgi:pentatricopeptide repeat protein
VPRRRPSVVRPTYHFILPEDPHLELIDVLRHEGPPRTTYFVEIPSAFGDLRLDLLGDVGVALSQSGVNAEDVATISDLLATASQLPPGIEEQALLDITRHYPFAANVYTALAGYYAKSGNRDEALYYLKQMVALQPTYEHLTDLGRALGQAGYFEQAFILQSYLWERRKEVAPAQSYDVIRDYLITLSKSGNPKAVIHVAAQAISEMGNDTMLLYQFIYAHIQDGQYAEARALLDKALPLLSSGDALYSHFFDLSNALDALVAENRKHRN